MWTASETFSTITEPATVEGADITFVADSRKVYLALFDAEVLPDGTDPVSLNINEFGVQASGGGSAQKIGRYTRQHSGGGGDFLISGHTTLALDDGSITLQGYAANQGAGTNIATLVMRLTIIELCGESAAEGDFTDDGE